VNRDAVRRTLAARLAEVEERLERALRRAGRLRSDVTLVAVTKTVDVEVAALLPELGIADLGENRPQELWRKAAVLSEGIRWHLIGHLQRNKVDRTVPLTVRIHSVDSVRLLRALEEESVRRQTPLSALLEINAGGEASKHGFRPDEVPALAAEVAALHGLRIDGLMTLAAFEEDAERTRPTFALLRQLRDELRRRLGQPNGLPHLSMGMSNDFEVAVEEGATFVRLGTVLFEGLGGTPA
jgi:pyridoxal phosphate enzyme (YggS family)